MATDSNKSHVWPPAESGLIRPRYIRTPCCRPSGPRKTVRTIDEDLHDKLCGDCGDLCHLHRHIRRRLIPTRCGISWDTGGDRSADLSRGSYRWLMSRASNKRSQHPEEGNDTSNGMSSLLNLRPDLFYLGAIASSTFVCDGGVRQPGAPTGTHVRVILNLCVGRRTVLVLVF